MASSRGRSSAWTRVPRTSRVSPQEPDPVDVGQVADLAADLGGEVRLDVLGPSLARAAGSGARRRGRRIRAGRPPRGRPASAGPRGRRASPRRPSGPCPESVATPSRTVDLDRQAGQRGPAGERLGRRVGRAAPPSTTIGGRGPAAFGRRRAGGGPSAGRGRGGRRRGLRRRAGACPRRRSRGRRGRRLAAG